MYKAVLRPLLFRMDPERAHHSVKRVLAFAQNSSVVKDFVGRIFSHAWSKPVRLGKLAFPNPIGLAGGFDKDAELVGILPALGFGFIEVGTITPEPQPGNVVPRLFRIPENLAVLNRMGFNNCGVRGAAEHLKKFPNSPVPIGVNIGKGVSTPLEEAAQDYLTCFKALFYFADYFVFNISSPNTAELKRLHEPARLRNLLATVALENENRKTNAKPLFIKISPDLSEEELSAVVRIACEYRAGIVCSNTTVKRDGLSPAWETETGGLSGRPLRDMSTRMIQRIKQISDGKIPIIGVGGVFTAEDAREKLEAGADLVQVYTGLIYEGPGIVKSILKGLA
ncbi:MAG: quinone-dependent dihydroorotate dehydrogenase [Elusimicrobia bacterium]|nr:quinone-dependent dihydroorotate dehydrogenase [Elusimicrobiota bacterium]